MKKNMNKVRHIPYGRKRVYFDDVKKVGRFVNLYKDLFIGKDYLGTGKRFVVNQMNTDKGIMYELIFVMNHDDMRDIEKAISFKRKSFMRKYDWCSDQKYVVKYFVS